MVYLKEVLNKLESIKRTIVKFYHKKSLKFIKK